MLIVFIILAVLASIAAEIAAMHFFDRYEIEWRPVRGRAADAAKMNAR